MKNIKNLLIFIAVYCLSNSPAVVAQLAEKNKTDQPDQNKNVVFYRTPEERREAGAGTQITSWLKLSVLLELEYQRLQLQRADKFKFDEKQHPVKVLQLAFDFTLSETLEAAIVLETEDAEKSKSIIDEAAISWQLNDIGFTIGRYSPAFGEYYHHFIVGPMLEFGELRSNSFTVDYSLNDNVAMALFWLASEVGKKADPNSFDWGAAIEWASEDESIKFGLSYLSDIGESNAGFFKEAQNGYLNKVDAVSGFAMLGFKSFEFTAEMVKTLSKFKQFEPGYDQPEAYNIEAVYWPTPELQLSLRSEFSKEFEDNPQQRYGIAMRWLVIDNVMIAVDYLTGNYKKLPEKISNIEADEELTLPLINEQIIAFQLSIEI